MANIEHIMTRGADKQPSGSALLFFKHGMEPIFVSAGWADFKFFFYN